MSNKPVAWIDKSKLDDWLHGDCFPDQCFIHYQVNDAIPLYTHQYERPHNTVLVPCDKLAKMQAEIEALKSHPVEEQDESFDRTASHMAGEYVSYKAELTDDEILDVAYEILEVWNTKEALVDFARAILRKAQENVK